jgi:hypothetical protein
MRGAFYVCLTVPLKGQRAAFRASSLSIEDVGDMIDQEGGMAEKGPITYAYWELLCASGIADRALAEAAGLVPKRSAPKEKDVPVPASDPDVAVHSI